MTKANWIDVSYFQDPEKFDYQAAKQAGIQGLIIRAGYGKTQDTAAAQHIANAQKYGFMWHLYHYWYNMDGEADWAAQNANSLGLTANQYLFLDMEDKSLPADWNGQFAMFCKAVGDAYNVGLYCSDSPYKAKFQDSQLQQLNVARWIASYSYEPANYDIWQLSGAGGGGFGSYTGDVDRDYTKSNILSLYATANINPVVVQPTADLQYIQPIMLQPGYDTETNIYGLGYSPDNGVHFYVTYTTFGRKYRQEDADRLWKYLQGSVSKQIASAVSLTWDNIKGKPDLVLRSDLPDFNQFALKKGLPAPVDLSGYAKIDAVEAAKATAENALSKAEEAQSTADANSKALADKADKSEIPDISGLAKKSDIPAPPDLSGYALKSQLPSLSGYAKLTDIPSVAGLVKEAELDSYAKKSDLPDVSGLTNAPAFQALQGNVTNLQSEITTLAGVNLANGTSSEDQTWGDASQTTGWVTTTIATFDNPQAGQQYTISVNARTNGGTCYMQVWDGTSPTQRVNNVYNNDVRVTQEHKFTATITWPSGSYKYLLVQLVNHNDGGQIVWNSVMIEEGTIAHAWSPSPTEILTQLDYAKIKGDTGANATSHIDTDNLHQIKKPSEYSEGFSYELKNVNEIGLDRTNFHVSVQQGNQGLLTTVSLQGFARQKLEILDSDRPLTFERNGAGDTWHSWAFMTTW